jgi:hypothetical protein
VDENGPGPVMETAPVPFHTQGSCEQLCSPHSFLALTGTCCLEEHELSMPFCPK